VCRSIKRLRNPAAPATDAEVRAAALQFVRKISGYHTPSAANREAFENAIEAVAAASAMLLDSIGRPGPRESAATPEMSLS
jgi:hypothetical protein